VLISEEALSVRELNGAKFISGANLCMNLTDPTRVFAFYNPPGARGEDTFLSTLLSKRDVRRVPCYTFHDGFSTYNHIMEGVLLQTPPIDAVKRLSSPISKGMRGWVRYKPLLLYITKNGEYEASIQDMKEKLTVTLPKLCDYFRNKEFMGILDELETYHKKVRKHYAEFQAVQNGWGKICKFLAESAPEEPGEPAV
jgi:hypothetical protein